MSINNKRSYTEYTITQPTTDFAIGFDDFDEGSKDNILVTLNGVLVESLGYAAIRKNESTVTITPAITEGTVRLTRETDIDEPFHKFTAGALFSAKSMDENFQQVRHSQQEVRDGFVFLEYNTNGIVQASKEATAQARAATVVATASAVRAESAADTAVQAVGSLQGVVDAATTATTQANAATSTANTAASQATAATTSAQNAAQDATVAKQEAAAATANAKAATVDTLAATGRAIEAAVVVEGLTAAVNSRVSAVEASQDATIVRVDNFIATDVVPIVNDAINSTAVDGGILADTFVTVDNTLNQRQLNRGLNSVGELLSIVNPSEGMRVYVNSYHEGLGVGGGEFYYNSSRASENDGGSVLNGFVRSKRETITPYSFGVKDKLRSGEQIQKFFDFLGSDKLGYSYDISCDTLTDRLLTLTNSSGLTKTVSGYMKLNVSSDLKDNASPNLLTLESLQDWMFEGGFYINGYTAFSAESTIINAVFLHDCRRIQINRIEGRGTEGFLLVTNPGSNNNMSTFGKIAASNCGLRPGIRPATPYAFIESTGTITSSSYRSFIDIDLDSVPTFLVRYMLLVISGEPQVVMNYDSTNKTATIFPGFGGSHEHTNEAALIYGGALLSHGGDSGELSYDLLTATNCGIAHLDKSLYGSTGKRLTTQHCGVAFASGTAPASVGGYGTVIQQPYAERNNFDLISLSSAAGGTFIAPIALDIRKCRCISAPGSSTTNLARFNIIGFYDQTPASGKWISSPIARTSVWAGQFDLSNHIPVYLDGANLQRTDRVLRLIENKNSQSYIQGWSTREVVFYNVIKAFKISCEEGETVNNLPEITVQASEVKEGTILKANKIGTNWVVKFYPPYEKPEKNITYSDNIPSTGYHNKGDITYNTMPSDGSYVGWVCTESGESGTWLPFGKIGGENPTP